MITNKELLKGSTTTIILNLLQTKDMYGYEMIKEIEKNSEGVFNLKEGTLYPILHSLEIKGILTSYWDEGEGARKRKYYCLTDGGRELLVEKKKEWVTFRSAIDNLLKEGTTCH
jgi:PadR family transcriptional regulator PadR